ncbi:c-type cytochrome [Deinococcus radiophilus]|uniref:C-type cytochrome n=2 Tax=Deinococcus radiophilus TaxID=32062 RepID=A0A431VV85_9DEIO|nr:c-type cytochrome [Deinococcus radiophilus]RTR27055.1 c-type cytochrome [Deinococcus radiophilus]UFA50163.1 c-type cytochrome [Deinococcus radiophilus]
MTSLRTRMTQGNIVSWLTGILLGVVLGVALLFLTNAGAPSATDPVKDGVAVTTDASATEAAEDGNTPDTAGITQGSQGGISDTSTNASPSTAPTVGDPATTASDDNEEVAAETEEAGSGESDEGGSGTSDSQATEGESAASESEGGAAEEATPAAGATESSAQGDAAAGQEIFAGSCGGCHGAQGQGGIGPAMTENANGWDLTGFTQTLREGVTPDGRELAPTMPRFSEAQLSDADVANIHAWVQSL